MKSISHVVVIQGKTLFLVENVAINCSITMMNPSQVANAHTNNHQGPYDIPYIYAGCSIFFHLGMAILREKILSADLSRPRREAWSYNHVYLI